MEMIIGALIAELAVLLGTGLKSWLADNAKSISATEPESKEKIIRLFAETKKRLATSWKISIFMTITLFVLFTGFAVTAVVSGLILNQPTWSVIFGGLSAISFFTVVIWKPYEKMFQAVVTTQRLEMILLLLEQEWAACCKLEDGNTRLDRTREINQSALREIEKMATNEK